MLHGSKNGSFRDCRGLTSPGRTGGRSAAGRPRRVGIDRIVVHVKLHKYGIVSGHALKRPDQRIAETNLKCQWLGNRWKPWRAASPQGPVNQNVGKYGTRWICCPHPVIYCPSAGPWLLEMLVMSRSISVGRPRKPVIAVKRRQCRPGARQHSNSSMRSNIRPSRGIKRCLYAPGQPTHPSMGSVVAHGCTHGHAREDAASCTYWANRHAQSGQRTGTQVRRG